MSKPAAHYQLNRAEVIALLKRYAITPTRQRIEIATFMFQKPQHLSAERILDGVNSHGHRVSRATIYNTMGLFAHKGLVREVLVDRECVFYDSNNGAHHHLFNIDTGELSDIDDAAINIQLSHELHDDMHVVETDVIIRVSNRKP